MRLIFTSFLIFIVLVSNAQNVGINNTTPEKPLHITGNNELLRLQGSHPWIGFMNETETDYKSYLYQNHTSNTLELGSVSGSNISMALSPNGSGLLFANPNQRVGIGTSAPEEKLHVNGIVKADELKYTSPRISYYGIGTPDFTSRDGDYTISREVGAGYASIDQNDPVGLGMVAPIHLPHGSKITQIQIVGRDVSATSDLSISIVTRAYSTLSTFAWVTQASSGAPGNFTINHTLSSPLLVENDLNYYMIQVSGTVGWNATQLGIYGVRLTYSVEKAD